MLIQLMTTKSKHALAGFTITLMLSFSNVSLAALINTGKGLIYDNDLNITWTQDANLFKTMAATNPNLVKQIIDSNGGVIHDTPNSVDPSGTYNLKASDFNATTGRLDWWAAKAYVGYLNQINYDNYNHWRLPNSDAVFGFPDTGSELGHLYYTELKNSFNAGGGGPVNKGPFSNLESYVYWTGTEYKPNPRAAWYFTTTAGASGCCDIFYYKGIQFYAIPVGNGDVSAVPIPASIWMMGGALSGMVSYSWRKLPAYSAG
ncbi:MAG: DUF1566 domain-containing protein [Methylobacter sp.]|nr:DUF1566 domain-containing protein [Methylobacter sp.]